MTKNEFIKKFNLTKTNTTCFFRDGMASKNRTLYIDCAGNLFVFYNNDLYAANPFKEEYTEGMESIRCSLGAGYSWYH